MCVAAPLLGVEEGEDVLAGHEALLHVAQLEVVHLEHVLLLFLLQGERERRAGSKRRLWEDPFYLFLFGSGLGWSMGTLTDFGKQQKEYSHSCCFSVTMSCSLLARHLHYFFFQKKSEGKHTSDWDKRSKRKEDKVISGGNYKWSRMSDKQE